MERKFVKWIFNVTKWKPNLAEFDLCLRCLQEDDKERIGKFSYLRDAKSCSVGRLMIRQFASTSLNMDNTSLVVLRSDKGRPYVDCRLLKHMNKLDFNVTHQGDYVAFVGTTDGPVGIDVMEFEESRGERKKEFFHLMKRQFTPMEWAAVYSSTPYENIKSGYDPQLATFYRLWALKESYVKAKGIGIGFDLQRLNFCIKSFNLHSSNCITDTELFVDGKPDKTFTFEETLIDESHIVVVARMLGVVEQPEMFANVCFDELVLNLSPILDSDMEYCSSLLLKE